MPAIKHPPFSKIFKIGAILKFASQQIRTNIPHFFVVLTSNPNELILLCCFTTKCKKREKYFEKRKIDFQTLVWVVPDASNKLHTNSYIDCNTLIKYSYSFLEEKYNNNQLLYTGVVKDQHLEQILNGVIISKTVEREYQLMLKQILTTLE